MIAHVAEAGEQRGRVVLRLGPTIRTSQMALEAAMRVAQAFGSEVESVFIEDRQLLDLANFPFAREISLTGKTSRQLSSADIEREMRHVAAVMLREVDKLARQAEVRVRRRVLRDEPLRALAEVCAACGPWNVLALAEPLTAAHAAEIGELFSAIADATGIVAAGPATRRTQGPVVVAVEELERLPPMLRAAERLASATGSDIRIFLIGRDEQLLHWMEGQTRLLLANSDGIPVERVLPTPGLVNFMERLRKIECGFLVVRYGGLIVPAEGDLRPLSSALECPLFLIR